MYPEDRVLVGVVNRKRDLNHLQAERWYRIPQGQMPRGVYTDYLAFFLSGAAAPKGEKPGVYWYAEYRGVELVYRHQLLPAEIEHPRANNVYYKVQVGELQPKSPPIANASRRVVYFIHTTWDRFQAAQTVHDLYSPADQFVDRIYFALEGQGMRPSRFWEADKRENPFAPGFGVLCERGEVLFSMSPQAGAVFLDPAQSRDAILHEILQAIAENGGPVVLSLPDS